LVAVKFFQPDRTSEKAVDGAIGESLMRLALNNNVDGIIGECGGEMSCATCQIYVDEPWRERIAVQSSDELDLLEMSNAFSAERSRLACQIRLTDDLDDIEVEVAPGNGG